MEKITKKDIINDVAENYSNLAKKEVALIIDEAVLRVFTALQEGKTVDLTGFGKFEVTERAARTGINPATKEKIEIAASKAVKFKSAKALKEAVNK